MTSAAFRRAVAAARRVAVALGVVAIVGGLGMIAPGARADVESAERAWDRGERGEAARDIRAWLRQHPEGARSARATAMLARTAADPAEAASLWDEVIALELTGRLAAEAHWQKAMHAYSAGLYVAASREFGRLGTDFGNWLDPSQAFLWKGYSDLGADEPEAARESFREAERGVSDRLDVASVQLGIANANFRIGNVREAHRQYQRFEREHRDDGRASAAARRGVECLRLLGREQDAAAAAARIGLEYPDSFEATLARAEIRTLRDREVRWREGRAEVPTPKGPFIVQVAAMTDPRNAATLRRQILALGIREIEVESGEGPDGPVHRVLLGPYPDEATARAIADSVAVLGDLNPRVREVESR